MSPHQAWLQVSWLLPSGLPWDCKGTALEVHISRCIQDGLAICLVRCFIPCQAYTSDSLLIALVPDNLTGKHALQRTLQRAVLLVGCKLLQSGNPLQHPNKVCTQAQCLTLHHRGTGYKALMIASDAGML